MRTVIASEATYRNGVFVPSGSSYVIDDDADVSAETDRSADAPSSADNGLASIYPPVQAEPSVNADASVDQVVIPAGAPIVNTEPVVTVPAPGDPQA